MPSARAKISQWWHREVVNDRIFSHVSHYRLLSASFRYGWTVAGVGLLTALCFWDRLLGYIGVAFFYLGELMIVGPVAASVLIEWFFVFRKLYKGILIRRSLRQD